MPKPRKFTSRDIAAVNAAFFAPGVVTASVNFDPEHGWYAYIHRTKPDGKWDCIASDHFSTAKEAVEQGLAEHKEAVRLESEAERPAEQEKVE